MFNCRWVSASYLPRDVISGTGNRIELKPCSRVLSRQWAAEIELIPTQPEQKKSISCASIILYENDHLSAIKWSCIDYGGEAS